LSVKGPNVRQNCLVAFGFVLLGCAGAQSKSECDDLPQDAWRAIASVDGQRVECSADSECRAVKIPSGCWNLATCTEHFVGNADLEQALTDAANGVAKDLCERFDAQSCVYGAPSCPYVPADSSEAFRCEQGRCVSTLAPNPAVGE
jgi:hypothetical protein